MKRRFLTQIGSHVLIIAVASGCTASNDSKSPSHQQKETDVTSTNLSEEVPSPQQKVENEENPSNRE
ncbi:hypothetical protein [Bacillus marasmi]|uniref:hypothetical protein n=1 Tax=Bacillus marasmi TaxID=1926279 RepID=UPI0011CC2EF4|nr:hypothetical protein [Bacillus marasmi]